jgi:ATP-dependent DNA helicase RecQ
VTRSGKIVACSEGRAVAYANDPGWPELIAELEGPDAPPSPELVDALIGVLRDWRPPKPGAIAAVPDPTHPQRTAGIVEALSTQLRLPAIDALTWAGPKVPDKLASGAHVVIVEERLLWANDVDIPEAAILLVSATARSRWTLTVAAAMFREAGATDALPLVAHLKP